MAPISRRAPSAGRVRSTGYGIGSGPHRLRAAERPSHHRRAGGQRRAFPARPGRRSSRPSQAADNFSIVNNTFYDYMNRLQPNAGLLRRYREGQLSPSRTRPTSRSISPPASVSHDIDAGFTYRYAHVLDIQNFANEPVSVFDLSGNPSTWMFPPGQSRHRAARCLISQPSVTPNTAFRDAIRIYRERQRDSNLQDGAIFLEHRMQFSPQWSVLYGLRGDMVQLNEPTRSAARAGTHSVCRKRSTPAGMGCTTETSAWCTARPRMSPRT